MNIIYDALNKVDDSISKNDPAPKQNKPHFRPGFLYIFIICLGLFTGNVVFPLIHRNHQITSPFVPVANTNTTVSPRPANLQVTNPPPAPAIVPEPVLVLNGVFFEQGKKGYALINNRIAQVGDKIEGAKIKEISLNGVEVEFGGKTIKLTSPSK